MGIFLFGLVLLFDAATKATVALHPGKFSVLLLNVAIVLTAITVTINVYVCWMILQAGGMPTFSALAVAFGGWIFADEMRALRRMRLRTA